jgi:hypothetical protein
MKIFISSIKTDSDHLILLSVVVAARARRCQHKEVSRHNTRTELGFDSTAGAASAAIAALNVVRVPARVRTSCERVRLLMCA